VTTLAALVEFRVSGEMSRIPCGGWGNRENAIRSGNLGENNGEYPSLLAGSGHVKSIERESTRQGHGYFAVHGTRPLKLIYQLNHWCLELLSGNASANNDQRPLALVNLNLNLWLLLEACARRPTTPSVCTRQCSFHEFCGIAAELGLLSADATDPL
jgi:hypothetical protein